MVEGLDDSMQDRSSGLVRYHYFLPDGYPLTGRKAQLMQRFDLHHASQETAASVLQLAGELKTTRTNLENFLNPIRRLLDARPERGRIIRVRDLSKPRAEGGSILYYYRLPANQEPSPSVQGLRHTFEHQERFNKMYESYSDLVRGLFKTKGLQPEDTNDLTQRFWGRVWEILPRYAGLPMNVTWIYKVVGNLFLDYARENQRFTSRHMGGDQEMIGLADTDPMLLGPFMAEYNEDVRELRSALADLDQDTRIIVEMFYIQNKPAKDIAQTLGIETEDVYSTTRRGLDRLRKILVA